MIITDLPLYIGASSSTHNPNGIPDTFPFEACFDESVGLIRQKSQMKLSKILDDVYGRGLLIGTPLSENALGISYADDFLDFIGRVAETHEKLKILEVGAGTGYLSRRLIDLGHNVISIEPGTGYARFWEKYEVDVINEFFPSPLCAGPYDLIISYLVLEHIADPLSFIYQMKNLLGCKGALVFAVPDVSEEIVAGDPSILVHEHFNYFDTKGLMRLLSNAGLVSVIEKSRYGRCLYSFSKKCDDTKINMEVSPFVVTYLDRCIEYIKVFKKEVRSLLTKGTVGIFCPGRALALLELGMDVRMFDDDPYLTDMFFPPFISRIENRSGLLNDPVDYLIIMSRTFGKIIEKSLIQDGYKNKILIGSDLL